MRDFELEPTGTRSAVREDHAPATGTPTARAIARSPALDTASILHLQRTAGNAAVVQLLASDEDRSPVHDVLGSGGGAPLDVSTRATMESQFGTSFAGVRVHTDDRASRSAEAVGANAYTVGSDVVFRSGHYDPGTPTGQRTIAHELAHVVQQSQGAVDGTAAPGGIRVSDPSDRFERAAESRAGEVVSRVQAGGSSAPAAAAPAIQREAEDAPVQRQVPMEQDEEDQTGG